MDKHVGTKYKAGNMQALRRAKPVLTKESRAHITKLLANGDSTSRRLVHVLYSIDYKDMKEFT